MSKEKDKEVIAKTQAELAALGNVSYQSKPSTGPVGAGSKARELGKEKNQMQNNIISSHE